MEYFRAYNTFLAKFGNVNRSVLLEIVCSYVFIRSTFVFYLFGSHPCFKCIGNGVKLIFAELNDVSGQKTERNVR